MKPDLSTKRNLRILVIDDQETIHQDYRKIIGVKNSSGGCELQTLTSDLFGDEFLASEEDGPEFEIDSAFQGEQGYGLVQAAIEEGRPYAMAFVDIRMPPGWDGIETVQRIWEIDPEILIVLCSAYSDYTWESMVDKLGRTDRFLILKKPFENIEVRQFAMALTERWNLARTDAMTGAMNRRALREQLQREWARSIRHDSPLACVMIDLDFFKKINDGEGHQAGDLVLQTVVNLLQTKCRASDLLFRYGGEEFCAVLPQSDLQGAETWAERTRVMLMNSPIELGRKVIQVSASFGIAQRTSEMQSAEALIAAADAALRSAKRLGRNRVEGMESSEAELQDKVEMEKQRTSFLQNVVAKNVMTSQVAALRRSTTVGTAARFFLDTGVNSAPIVDADGKLIGIVTEMDVLGVILLPNAWNWPLSKIAQADVVRYDEETPVEQIFDFLSRVTMRRVINVSDGRPVGSISRADLLRWFSNWVLTQSSLLSCESCSSNESPKTLLVEAAQALAARATRLCDELSSREEFPPLSDDLYGPLVGDISTMQTLLRDILAFSSLPLNGTGRLPSSAARTIVIGQNLSPTTVLAESS